ncbi:MAG: LEPR-XLL domain-containing protein [Verrucomicrobia bacterium]|nr:LEPR-XLL domain-containing protein [Verrucomicrobiota bacterium]
MSGKNDYILEALEPRLLLSADGFSGLAPAGPGDGNRVEMFDRQTTVDEVFDTADNSINDQHSTSLSSSQSAFVDMFENAEELQPDIDAQAGVESAAGGDPMGEAIEASASENHPNRDASSETVQADPGFENGSKSPVPEALDESSSSADISQATFTSILIETLLGANPPPQGVNHSSENLTQDEDAYRAADSFLLSNGGENGPSQFVYDIPASGPSDLVL